MESSRVILDSNVFIAFYLEKDSLHEQAVFIMEEVLKSEVIIPYCVIQETSTVLTYKGNKQTADSFLKDIRNANNMIIINNEPEEEMDFFNKFSEKISFTDTSIIFLAKKYRATLISFDKEVVKLYKRIG